MDRRVRALLLVIAVVQAVLAVLWVFQVPFVTGLWPFPVPFRTQAHRTAPEPG